MSSDSYTLVGYGRFVTVQAKFTCEIVRELRNGEIVPGNTKSSKDSEEEKK